MSESDDRNKELLPLGDLEPIDSICTQFEESWKAGNPARVEDLLQGFEVHVRAKLLLEFLLVEFEYRRRDEGSVPFDEYRQRFAEDLETVESAIEQFSQEGERTFLTPGQAIGQHIPERIRYLGDYEILEEIARGEMEIIFKARQSTLGRIVAVKLMLTGQHSSNDQIARFERKLIRAKRLQHPNIVTIHEVGVHEGHHYFSMDYIEGRSLAAIVHENPLPGRKAAEYARSIAEAVRQGGLYGDLKPSKILIDRDDNVQIINFGLAKMVEKEKGPTVTSSSIIGTPSYIPPEPAAARSKVLMSPQCYVYSLGAVLYELLTGHQPFAAATAIETMRQVETEYPVSPRELNPDVPKDLETICLKCLRREAHKRYGTAQELADDLQRFLDGEPISARPISRIERMWRWCLKRRCMLL